MIPVGRRQARIAALLTLYAWDITGRPMEEIWERTVEETDLGAARRFAADLVMGAFRSREHIDGIIDDLAVDWRLERMAVVDRNLLRLAAYELVHRGDVPTSVIINESVELAKMFSTPEAARFINGILGRMARQVRDPAEKV